MIERLVQAINRGVRVYIMARPPHTLKQERLLEGVGGCGSCTMSVRRFAGSRA